MFPFPANATRSKPFHFVLQLPFPLKWSVQEKKSIILGLCRFFGPLIEKYDCVWDIQCFQAEMFQKRVFIFLVVYQSGWNTSFHFFFNDSSFNLPDIFFLIFLVPAARVCQFSWLSFASQYTVGRKEYLFFFAMVQRR